MRSGGFFEPIASALALVPRWSSLVVWIVLVAMAVGLRQAAMAMASSPNLAGAASFTIFIPLMPTVLAGVLVFGLARAQLAPHTGDARPLYARFLGLMIGSAVLVWLVNLAGTVALFSNDPPPAMAMYGSALVGSVGSIAVFPFLVRMMATAAGANEPHLPGTVAYLFGEGRWAYVWCAVCAIAFPMLAVPAFAGMIRLDATSALPGTLLQTAITATGSLLRFLLAIVVARQMVPTARRQAEVFA